MNYSQIFCRILAKFFTVFHTIVCCAWTYEIHDVYFWNTSSNLIGSPLEQTENVINFRFLNLKIDIVSQEWRILQTSRTLLAPIWELDLCRKIKGNALPDFAESASNAGHLPRVNLETLNYKHAKKAFFFSRVQLFFKWILIVKRCQAFTKC